MTDTDTQRYTFRDPEGKVIGAGPLDQLMAYLPDSRAREDAEQLLCAAATAAGRIAEIDRRADSVAEREREVAERERALQADAVQRLVDSIDDLAARLTSYEQAQARAALDALPDPRSSARPLARAAGRLVAPGQA
jgi:hypothetical protein